MSASCEDDHAVVGSIQTEIPTMLVVLHEAKELEGNRSIGDMTEK